MRRREEEKEEKNEKRKGKWGNILNALIYAAMYGLSKILN